MSSLGKERMRRIFGQAFKPNLNLMIGVCFLAVLVVQNRVEGIALITLEPAVVSGAI